MLNKIIIMAIFGKNWTKNSKKDCESINAFTHWKEDEDKKEVSMFSRWEEDERIDESANSELSECAKLKLKYKSNK